MQLENFTDSDKAILANLKQNREEFEKWQSETELTSIIVEGSEIPIHLVEFSDFLIWRSTK